MPDIPTHLQPFVYGLTLIVGLCFGSFLNVVAHRFLSDQSISDPPSHCPGCETPLKWYENVPIIAYLIQGAKCRHCGMGIGIEYPLAELLTGLLFVSVVWFSGLTLQTLFLLFLICNLVVITITDFKESLIFQVNSLSLIPAGLLYNFLDLGMTSKGAFHLAVFSIPDNFISAVIAVALAFIIFEGLILFSEIVFGTEGFGHGDTHLMMGVGAFVGWDLMLLALFLGFVLQAVPAIPMLIWQWYKKGDWLSLSAGTGGIFLGILATVFYVIKLSEEGFLSLQRFFEGLGVELSNAGMESMLDLIILGSLLLTLVAAIMMLKRMKESESYTYLPLGPALVLGSLTVLFFGYQMINFYMVHWLGMPS